MESEIKTINIENKNYPKLLKLIPDAPKILYFKGNLDVEEKPAFAVVGTRRYSDYGKQATLEIVGDLVNAGLVIVSGMAKGIDTFAHKACLERKGRTVAVLGSGIDEKSIYPKENLKLARKIIEAGGTVISEFSPGTTAFPHNFPKRNRIISGLSLGVLVVEAKKRSGALITANYAFSQKRKVFSVPGNIRSLNSQGPHNLIKKGAKLIENVNDILKELNLPEKELNFFGKIRGETLEEKLILEALKNEPLYIDKIIKKTKIDITKVNSTLAVMEIKGQVKNLGGNIYAIDNR